MRITSRRILVPCCLLVTRTVAAQGVTATVDDTVIAPKTRVGIGVNAGNWYNLVTANLPNNSAFEAPADADGVSNSGWPWALSDSSAAQASVDGTTYVSGRQSQKVVVTSAPVTLSQGEVTLPQLPLVMQVTPAGSYVIKAQVKADNPSARVRLGIMVNGWSPTFGPSTTVSTSWGVVSWTYVAAQAQNLVGFAIQFQDNATYWLDDFVAYDASDVDPSTGLSARYVERLKELKPATLRLGGLGLNGVPLETLLFRPWSLAYGPPPLEPDFDLVTFLLLCKAVGADPFLVMPPAFSDATHAALGDLTDDVIDNWYADHGNFVDYLGGDAGTPYGARREADGFSRWDLQFGSIYLELGNELWGTASGAWDMTLSPSDDIVTLMERFARYNQKRMTEMKARPGWRTNMRVGFCGRDPGIWIGNWLGSYNVTLVPALSGLTDMSTIGMYYGPQSGSTTDDALYGDLFAHAQWFGRTTRALRDAFASANGGLPLETTVYEGNAVWGPYYAGADPVTYAKEVSIGAAVSLVDHFGSGNLAGISINNLFHFDGNVWATVTNYPNLYRKPSFFAVKLFNTELRGDLVTCSLNGVGTYTSNLPSEPPVPLVACYAYKDGGRYQVLLINRSRSTAQTVTLAKALIPVKRVALSATDINANNENTTAQDAEPVSLVKTTLSGGASATQVIDVPAFSAVLFVGDDANGTAPAAIAPDAIADLTVDVAMDAVTFAASGTSPVTWTVSAGALPTGLTLDGGTGVLTGTPSAAGTFTFTLSATNAYGSVAATLQVVVHAADDSTDTPPATQPGTQLAAATGACSCRGGARDSPSLALLLVVALGLALWRRRAAP